MKSNEAAALAYVFADEGLYAERPEEGGGAVNRGVTFTVFKAWRATRGADVPTWADLKAMTGEEATQIYEAQFLTGVHFDDLPIGVDYCVLDAAINGGVAGSIKLLQGVLGLKPIDGHYGLVTRWAVQHRPVVALIDALCDARLAKYKTFKIFNQPYKAGVTKTWGDIWSARIEQVRKRAQTMVFATPITTVTAGPMATTNTVPFDRDAQYTKPIMFPPVKMPASTEISRGMVKRGFTPEQFLKYLHDEVAPKMGAFRPRGAVLHNTGHMVWPGIVNGKQISPEQRLDNMSVDWQNRHFPSGPHLVGAPDGLIWAAWPLWKPGTHSPSWNMSYWGYETVGDWNTEIPTQALIDSTEIALAGLYAMIGQVVNNDTFKFHLEDPKTTHKNCPGSNIGTKAHWITAINERLHSMNALA